jgi:hypothetical protein
MIIEVDISTFLHGASGSAVPQNLAGYIDQTKWTAIRREEGRKKGTKE